MLSLPRVASSGPGSHVRMIDAGSLLIFLHWSKREIIILSSFPSATICFWKVSLSCSILLQMFRIRIDNNAFFSFFLLYFSKTLPFLWVIPGVIIYLKMGIVSYLFLSLTTCRLCPSLVLLGEWEMRCDATLWLVCQLLLTSNLRSSMCVDS